MLSRRITEVQDIHQDAGKEVAEEMNMVRSKAFNFHSTRSVIVPNFKTKTNHRTQLHKYEIDITSDDNLMPIRMFKELYSNKQIQI